MTRKVVFLITLFTFTALPIQRAKAEMDPRMKAIGSLALYGAIGGALLGTASLAFGTEGRAVAKGASLGLYAGLLFGGYVVMSHYLKQQEARTPGPKGQNYYPDTSKSPYEEESSGGWFDWFGPPQGDEGQAEPYAPQQRFEPLWEAQESGLGSMNRGLRGLQMHAAPKRPVYYLNLVNFQF